MASGGGGGREEVPNIYFSRYASVVFMVGRSVMWQAFDWLYHHHHRHDEEPDLYVGERLRRSRDGWKRIGKKEEELLRRREEPRKMDIPLLYRCLQHTCGLAQEDRGFTWSQAPPDPTAVCLEHRLYQIKEARNALSHEIDMFTHMSTQEFDFCVVNLLPILTSVLREAGRRAGRADTEVDSAVTRLKESIKHIRSSVPSSSILPHEFALLAKKEIGEQWRGTKEHLSPPWLQWAAEGREVPLDHLLQGEEEGEGECLPQVVMVLGETGIGKSSLCQQLIEAWLSSSPKLPDVAGMDLVLYVECRRVFTRDLTRLLREEILPETCQRCSLEELGRVLSELRVLWLVDGFEEVTADARQLLGRLMERRADGHVVLLTGQPNYIDEVNAVVGDADVRVCHVTHRGLTVDGVRSLVASLLKEPIEAESGKVGERCFAFMKTLPAICGSDTMLEMRNPLKLILAVRLWEEGRVSRNSDMSLHALYSVIQDSLVDKLVGKLRSKNSMAECEARERVKGWVQALSKEALSMWARGCFVVLDGEAEQRLKECAMLLPYTDCFSTFLCYRSRPQPHYSFLHHTQQSVMAAQHIQTLVLQRHTEDQMTALLLPSGHTEATMDRFMDMLVMVATNLQEEGSLDEDRAEVLVALLGKCVTCPWLEVLSVTKCSKAMASHISGRIGLDWEVHDKTLEAANTMLEFRHPLSMKIALRNANTGCTPLMSLLTQVSKIQTNVELFIIESFGNYLFHNGLVHTVDELVLCLCGRPTAKTTIPTTTTTTATPTRTRRRTPTPTSTSCCCRCRLVVLKAFVSVKSCCVLLHHVNHLQVLHLGITDTATLEEVIALTHHPAINLQLLFLHIPFMLPSLPSRPASDRVPLMISLGSIEHQDAERCVALIRSINHTFLKIVFNEVKPATICKMLEAFKHHKVRTLSLCRWISFQVNSESFQSQPLHCFTLPLPVNFNKRTVYKMWDKPTVNMRIDEQNQPLTVKEIGSSDYDRL